MKKFFLNLYPVRCKHKELASNQTASKIHRMRTKSYDKGKPAFDARMPHNVKGIESSGETSLERSNPMKCFLGLEKKTRDNSPSPRYLSFGVGINVSDINIDAATAF